MIRASCFGVCRKRYLDTSGTLAKRPRSIRMNPIEMKGCFDLDTFHAPLLDLEITTRKIQYSVPKSLTVCPSKFYSESQLF